MKKLITALLLIFSITSITFAGNTKEDYYQQGLRQYMARDFQQAIATFNKALRIDKRYSMAYFGRASVYNKLQNFNKALYNYNKAIQYDRTNSDAFAGRGIIYARLKRYNRAISDFNRALALDPDNFIAAIGLQKVRSEMGR